MPRPCLTPRAYQRVTLAALLALAFIVVSGAAVRLTGSGLGCPNWPTCDDGRLVAPLEYHALVEFVNRTVTGFVSLAVIVAVLGALFRVPRRRDLVWLALGLVGGVAGQVVLGGLVVLFHLAPQLVMGHFLLSMVLLANAMVLHVRAGEPDVGEWRPVVDPTARSLGSLLVGAVTLAIFLGTVVTGAGPHAGSHDGELVRRLPIEVATAARFHGLSVVLVVGLTLALVQVLRSIGAPSDVQRRSRRLVAVLVAQAALGYTQYFTGVPVVLVGLHIVGAVAVWLATLDLVLSFRRRVPVSDRVAADLVGAP